MELVKVAYASLASIILLFVLAKIMGNRQISQMSLFDYINGITIGSIAAEMATGLEDIRKPMLAMTLYALAAVLMAYAACKSVVIRRIVTGKPMLLFLKGKFYEKNFKSARIDMSEFLTLCRNAGYFDLSQVYAAIMEENGQISFLPFAQFRPVTPEDMNLTPSQESLLADVIIDGKILIENLRFTGQDETWLRSQLQRQGVENLSEIFLATCDTQKNLKIYRKRVGTTGQDVFS